MNKNEKKQRLIVISLIAAILLMTVLLAVGSMQSARIQAALEGIRDRIEANKSPTTAAPKEPIKTMGYASLASGAIGTMKLYYYGDHSFYGRGTGTEPAVMANGAISTLLHLDLGATYGRGGSIGGRILTYTGNLHTTEIAAADFLSNYVTYGMDFRLAVLAPSDAILAENRAAAEKAGYRGSLSGEAGKDIEALVRTIRENTPRCDILLAVPYDASDALAEAILAVGEHYGLTTVDLRPIAEGEGMIHESGEDVGYPTAEGHRAIAKMLAEAIAEAVEGGFFTKGVPSTKLY